MPLQVSRRKRPGPTPAASINSSASPSATTSTASTSWRYARSRAGRASPSAQATRLRARRAEPARRDGADHRPALPFRPGHDRSDADHIVIIVQIDAFQVGCSATGCSTSSRSSSRRSSRCRGSRRHRAYDFLSGLVTINGGMIALIDLPRLLSVSAAGEKAGGLAALC